jgi:4-hydroxy-tetrahydrodipicolinate reductase
LAAKTKVFIGGISGRMGRAAARAILNDPELELVGGFSRSSRGQDIASLSGVSSKMTGILVSNEFTDCLAGSKPDVYLDFTVADVAIQNVTEAFENGISPVIGTSGITSDQFMRFSEISNESGVPGLVVPNFSVGAVLMMEFAKQAAAQFNNTEIVEMHHVGKIDAPSGTAMFTLKKMAEQNSQFNPARVEEKELLPGSRGARHDSGIRVHSMRLPGLISHQEVYFGSEGELLTIRHDSFNTECFNKGILLALKKVRSLNGFVMGLEKLLPGLNA